MSDNSVTFADLNLPETILQAITEMGYETPTAIQQQAIPHLIDGRDVVGVAQTGTGKTAAFALPMLKHTDPELREVQALVLAPTRELAMQGAEAIETFASKTGGLDVVAVYGGTSYGPQLGALRGGAQVVVGTPGRVMDLIDRGALKLETVRYFVLDEADEMLRMGFAEDVEKIASGLPNERISALFSATMPGSIRSVAQSHLKDPVEVTVSRQASTVDTITQTFAVVPMRHKIGALSRVLATTDADAALVFVRTRATAEELSLELTARGVMTAALSGDVQQKDREKLVERLRAGTIDVLVATDVAARGLDVERIGLVVNFDVPREIDTYVHRIGRTGRAGREGTALTFVTPKERTRLRRIEKVTGARMAEVELPTPAEVSSLRAQRIVDKAIERHAVGRLHVYEDVLAKFNETQSESESPLSQEDLIKALLALAVRDPGPQANDEPEFITAKFDDGGRERGSRGNDRGERRERRGDKRKPTFEGTGTMYRIEVGRRDGVSPGHIVGAITGEGGIAGSQLGKIDIFPSFSLVELQHELDEQTRRRIGKARVAGRMLNIAEDHGPGHRPVAGSSNDDPEFRKYRADRKFGDDRRKLRSSGRGEQAGDRRSSRGFRDENRERGFGRGDRRGSRFNDRGNDRGGRRSFRDNDRW
ncbi:DEAD/DEAH box helicase [Arcanobacterium ihumii]|uniref:DEAD/DEAH box helicase n=1 Tax=Arcanobacterium ihumii TaxID=2138162 RepID=UPI001F1D5ACF|nr:DEAD/DEAH box helicase [Arcanobacterium ihumii]